MWFISLLPPTASYQRYIDFNEAEAVLFCPCFNIQFSIGEWGLGHDPSQSAYYSRSTPLSSALPGVHANVCYFHGVWVYRLDQKRFNTVIPGKCRLPLIRPVYLKLQNSKVHTARVRRRDHWVITENSSGSVEIVFFVNIQTRNCWMLKLRMWSNAMNITIMSTKLYVVKFGRRILNLE